VWISDRLARPLALAAVVAALLAACGAESGDCLRYSDCSQGLTCAAGHCVVPPAAASDSDGGVVTPTTIDAAGAADAGDEPTPDEGGNGFFLDATTD
jgi:hypothetical protein